MSDESLDNEHHNDQDAYLNEEFNYNSLENANNAQSKSASNKDVRSESHMDNLRTEATTPMLVTNNTQINTLHTDISVNDISQDDRLAYANLNDEDLNVISLGHQHKHQDDDEISLRNI